MNPNVQPGPQLNLPPIQEPARVQAEAEGYPAAPEQAAPQLPPAPAIGVPAAPMVSAQPQAVGTTTASAMGVQSALGTPAKADDADLIEKEWVAKAKEIIAKTRTDPFEQSKQVSEFRADYMEKRFQKTVKLSE